MADKYLWTDVPSFSKLASADGKHLHWITEIKDELPIIMSTQGIASTEPLTIIQYLELAVKTHSKMPALLYKVNGNWVTWTYEDYYSDSLKFAASLVNLGIEYKSTINIIGFNSPQWVIGFCGAMFAGCVSVGVYTTNKSDICEYIASHSVAELILVQNEAQLKKYLPFWERVPSIKAIVVYWPGEELSSLRQNKKIYTWDEFLRMNNEKDKQIVTQRTALVKPNHPATLIYTSGTTGPPKGVIISHDNAMWTVKSLVEDSSIKAKCQERVVSYLPLSHIAPLAIDVIGCLYYKAALFFADEKALSGTIIGTLREVKPTIFFGVPRVYEKFEEFLRAKLDANTGVQKRLFEWAKKVGYESTLNQINRKPTSYSYSIANALVFSKIRETLGFEECHTFRVGAAPLRKGCLDFFLSFNIKLLNAYGMSETAAPTCLNTHETCEIYSAGTPLAGTELVIKGPQGELLPPGEKGEICFRGRNKFMGYYKNEQATKETIDSQGYIHSGDEGYLNEKGFLYITGRFKELIITAGGENIPPIIIENTLKEHCRVISNAFLVGDAKKHLSVLITLKTLPNPDGTFSNSLTPEVKNFFNGLGIGGKTVEDVKNDKAFLKYIQECLDVVNKNAVSRAQEIKKFRILNQDFSLPGGEFTPTMKIRRKFVIEKYSDVIQEIYNDPKL